MLLIDVQCRLEIHSIARSSVVFVMSMDVSSPVIGLPVNNNNIGFNFFGKCFGIFSVFRTLKALKHPMVIGSPQYPTISEAPFVVSDLSRKLVIPWMSQVRGEFCGI